MKVLVFGTSEFAVPALDAIAERHDVVGVVTQPDRAAGRGHKLVATPVKQGAEKRGLPVFTPERLKPFVEEVRALGAEAFAVASYGRIVPQALLDLVPIAFNVHPSMLPLYRGATPLQSAIRDGRTETGVTIIAMDSGMDTGDVLLQEPVAIRDDETYGELHDATARLGARMAVDAIDRYANDSLAPRSQDEIARARSIQPPEIQRTATRPLRKEDLIVDRSRPPRAVVDLVRSLAPQPLARATVEGEVVKIAAARVARDDEASGTATSDDGFVQDGVVLLRVVPANRPPMSGAAWRRSAVRT